MQPRADTRCEKKSKRELEDLVDFCRKSGPLLKRLREKKRAIEEELERKGGQETPRRYSDQFRNASLLSKELEKNRKARTVLRVREKHSSIQDVTQEWRSILLDAFCELVTKHDADGRILYDAAELARAGVSREEVGLGEEDE